MTGRYLDETLQNELIRFVWKPYNCSFFPKHEVGGSKDFIDPWSAELRIASLSRRSAFEGHYIK